MTNNCLIISVFNDGVYDLALNHLTALKKQGIENYMAFTTGKKTYNDFTEKGFNITFRKENNLQSGELNWSGYEFNKFDVLRYKIAKEYLLTYKYIWYLDIDTVVLDDINKYIPTGIDYDCYIQDDINMPCTGCILFKRTEAIIIFINKLIKAISNYNYKHNDQIVFRSLLPHMPNFKIKIFDRVKFPNGLLFFDEEIIGKKTGFLKAEKNKYEAIPNKSPVLVHANYMVGNEKKINAFKKYGLWII